MRNTALAVAVSFVLLCLFPALALAQEEEEGGELIEPPLYVTFVTPVNNSAQVHADVLAVIRAGGATATFTVDKFANGTLVNATADDTGIYPNATAGDGESSYTSQVFEHPQGADYRWSEPLDIVMSGSGAEILQLLNVSVRLGERGPAHNWTGWFEVSLGGTFESIEAENRSLLELPALQYRVEFMEPMNESTPQITLVEVWYLSMADSVHARLGTAGPWSRVGDGEGEFTFNSTLAPGLNTLQARVVDTAGRERIASVAVSFDAEAPRVAQAPTDGSVIPADEAAEIVFSEPIDIASAAAAITVEAPFTVDRVWSADHTTLHLSAAGSPNQAEVKVTVGPGLIDRAGNRFNDSMTWHFTMGPEEAPAELPLMLIVLIFAGVAVAGVSMWHAGRLKEQRRQYARHVAARQEQALPTEDAPPAGEALDSDRR